MLKAEICVIGAGSGGLSVASAAVQLGLSVILVEKDKMGGDCLNRGCVPSKALLSVAKKGGTFRQAHNHIKEAILKIAPHDSQERFEKLGCTVIRESVRFFDSNTLETEKGVKISARYFVIAAGSRPFLPPIEGLDADKIYTNETIFELPEKPDHLAIIGGGPIGVEMAQAHIKLGCKVTLLTRGKILSKDDPECVNVIREKLLKDGVVICEDCHIQSMSFGKTPIIKTTDDTFKPSHILVATGRQPNVDNLNLDAAKINYDEKGIIVNKMLKTNRNRIFAIGDIVKHGPQFTHIAGYHAGIVIRNICFKMWASVDYKALPWVTYTSPELAHIGITEAEALEKLGDKNVRVLKQNFYANDRAITENIATGFIKIVGRTNGKILGVSIVSENAGEMLPVWSLAIQKNLKMKDIAGLILPYPTISEIHKAITGAWYKDKLFSNHTKLIIRLLQKLPSF